MVVNALRGLFDADVQVEALTDFACAEPLRPREAERLARAVEKRRAEYAAGRTCARRALRRAGCAGDPELESREDRRVEWPAGFTGTVTHATGLAAAAVGESAAYAGLGLDAELRDRLGPSLYRQIARPEERAWLGTCGLGEALAAATLFSAKEAFYKAQYPVSETFLGFHDVRYVELPASRFRIELMREVPGLGAPGAAFEGRRAETPSHVLTGLALRR